MIALAVVLATALAAALAVISWLVYGRVDAADGVADARVAQVATEAELERVQFELTTTKQSLQRTTARATALEEELFRDHQPNTDLDPGDWRARLRRLAERWSAAETGGGVPTEPDDAVPPPTAADPAGVVALSTSAEPLR